PGYSHFIIAPHPSRALEWVKGSYDSIRGRVSSEWSQTNDHFNLNITVPPNTTATLYLPTGDAQTITENGKKPDRALGVALRGMDAGRAVLSLTSGKFSFQSRLNSN